MIPRRDCIGRLPGNSTRKILGLESNEPSLWTPGPLGIHDWAGRYAKGRLYAQAEGGTLPLATAKLGSGVSGLVIGKIDFLILELGPDQKDSVAFKKAMEKQKLGRDLTPNLSSPG